MFSARVSLSSFLELPIFLLIACFPCLINAQPFDYPTATLSTLWANTPTANHSVNFTDGTTIRSILLTQGSIGYGPAYACGFYCNETCVSYMFAIFIVQTNSGGGISLPSAGFPQVVWSANRNSPVKINSTLELTAGGDLVLKDADGTIAWSTNTSGKSVAGMNLTEAGNLLLFDTNNMTVWQSFDYPTDSLVPGQRLTVGQKLTASVSSTNWTQLPFLSFTMTRSALYGVMETEPPQIYYQFDFGSLVSNNDTVYSRDTGVYVEYQNGRLALFLNSKLNKTLISVPSALSAQYMKLGPDGHLRVYEWSSGKWTQVADLLTGYLGDCAYPLACGEYGICTNGQCSCPASSNGTTYFRPNSDRNPNLGCSVVTPLSCGASEAQSFLELGDTFYFITDYSYDADLMSVDRENCTQTCAGNCSCEGAIFQYGADSSSGSCYLLSQVFSLMNNEQDNTHRNSTAYIKIQSMPSISEAPPTNSKANGETNSLPIILGSSLSALFVLVLLIGYLVWRRKYANEPEEDYLDQVPGMPTRFSYEDLKTATQNFSKKLGAGGFGSVFEGILSDGTRIAVKQLEGLGQIKKSFLAEVETIGSIHHVNLVRLVGFCAEKSHRLLVYEFMANGSLDRWIYHKNNEIMLEWEQRRKIILDIAKGLNYLHEDCRQKIIHLDIKPQNILLDEHFNAKVSDFGLSKLIDRDQSQVMTTMRGTPGYLAPEWLSAMISEKVDVYSFGVVILEVVCGRKVFDNSLDEDDMHLLGIFKRKAEEERLLDMVDKCSEDMQLNGEKAVNMMRIAVWCLQGDFSKRPSMSMVIKVLEGVLDVETELDYNFLNPRWTKATAEIGHKDVEFGSSTPLLPSVLSGPR